MSSTARYSDSSIDVIPSDLIRPGAKLRVDSSIDETALVLIRTRS